MTRLHESIEGVISDVAFGGDGVLKNEGFVVFVPFTAPEELVEVELTKKKRAYAFGKISKIKKSSPFRILPKCAHFTKCGGCQFQHIDYSCQLEVKRSFVQEALKRIGGIDAQVDPVVTSKMRWGYRRHVRLNIKKMDQGFICGYISTDNKSLIEVQECPLFLLKEDSFFTILKNILQQFSNEGVEQGSLRIFKEVENEYFLAFSFSPKIPQNAKNILEKTINKNCQFIGAIFQAPGMEESVGITKREFEIEGLKISYSPFGFTQNNPEQSLHLYRSILKNFENKTHKILDLYCGVGITSLLLSQIGKTVIGIEQNEKNVAFAKQNAKDNNLNVEFLCSTVEAALFSLLQTFYPDGILLNPPRTGATIEILEIIAKLKIKEIIYVSCMPSTLARDLKFLIKSGYKIYSVQPFDMFPQTTHVETLVKLIFSD